MTVHILNQLAGIRFEYDAGLVLVVSRSNAIKTTAYHPIRRRSHPSANRLSIRIKVGDFTKGWGVLVPWLAVPLNRVPGASLASNA